MSRVDFWMIDARVMSVDVVGDLSGHEAVYLADC